MSTGDRVHGATETQSAVRSLNPPSIPVRMNRRTQLKPLSRLNGDWLPLLKKIRTSEMTGQVRGHNASEELHTQRTVEQWFGDTAWQLGKLNKAQEATLTDLTRLHLERRELRRNMMKWRKEEARQQEERDRQHEARQIEMARLNREIELNTEMMRRESRRMSKRLTDSLFNQSDPSRRRSRVSVSSESPATLVVDPSMEDPLAEARIPNKGLKHTQKESAPPRGEATLAPPDWESSRGEMVKARVLEVRRGGLPPLVRTRTKSDLGQDQEDEESSNEVQKEESKEEKQELRKEEKKEERKERRKNKEDDLSKEEIRESPAKENNEKEAENSKDKKEQVKPKTTRKIKGKTKDKKRAILLESINQVSLSNSPSPRARHPRWSKMTYAGAPFFPSPSPALATIEEDQDAVPKPDTFPFTSETNPLASESSTSASLACLPTPVPVPVPKISMVVANKRRYQQRLRMQEKILQEPYVAYRKDKATGHLRPLEHPPVPPNFAEPSNKNEYRRVCLLRNERILFEEKSANLETYTANLLQQDAKQRSEALAAHARQEEEERLLAEQPPEIRVLGPSDWMRAFVHSGAPVGEDPDDPDNIKHCRYIRKDSKGLADDDPATPRRKISSWDPVDIS